MISPQFKQLSDKEFVKRPHYVHLIFEVKDNHKALQTLIRQTFKKIQKDLIKVF